ncbi:MAG: cytoplasmic protein [Candidatus Binatia bacterium]
MHRLLILVAFASISTLAAAQDPVKTDSDKYKVLFENDCVRVLDYRDRPSDRTNQHKHPAFVLYSRSEFKRTITLPDGKVLQRQFKEGDVMWSDS